MSSRPAPSAPPLATRAADVQPSTLDESARTVEVIWTTGARVMRGSFDPYYEELSLDRKHVRMERLTSGRAPLLDMHQASSAAHVLGVIESARIEKGRGVAVVRFAKDDPTADAVWNKVRQGVIRSVSVGYRVHKFEKAEGGEGKVPVMRAVDWEPFEVSVVPIGADAEAHFRAEETHMEQRPEESTEHRAAAAERKRVADIMKLTARHANRLESGFLERLIQDGVPLDEARSLVLNRLADMSDAIRTEQHVRFADTEFGDSDRRVPLMAEALAARFGGAAPSDEARQYMRLRTVDMAKHCLETHGVRTGLLSDNQIITRAMHTTSDFPSLLTETGNRFLRSGYESYQGGVRRICRESSAPDFRAKSKLNLGEAPALLKVNEHGEFTAGTMAASKESYKVETFGRIFGLTRQALVNDDLGAFADLVTKLGRASAEFVAQQLVDLLASNPTMTDGVAVFHASHGNLGTTAAISLTSLTEALKMMRLQKGLDGKTPIDATPKYLIVPAALEVIAKQYIAQITATKASDVNPFVSNLEPVVDPRLDAKSATTWYLAADSSLLDTIEYSYLDGAPGPQIDTQQGFEFDGVQMKVRLDFGAGVLDYRGLFKNVGA
jgi:HK97 family phage prohead protease